MSISNYQPELVEEIDRGNISVSKAYEIVREKYIQSKFKKSDGELFVSNFRKFLKKEVQSLDDINKTLKETYPYCLELTGVDEDRRLSLIEHLEYLKQLDSREMMVVQKKDELEQSNISPKELSKVKGLLPSHEELMQFFSLKDADKKFIITDDKSDKKLDSRMKYGHRDFDYDIASDAGVFDKELSAE